MFVMMPPNVMTNARQNSPKSLRQVCRFLPTDTTLITGASRGPHSRSTSDNALEFLPEADHVTVRLKPDTTSVEESRTLRL